MPNRRDTGHPSHYSGTEEGGADALSADVVGILDTVDVPIIVINRDCTLARVNRAATEAFGVAASDIGRPLSDIAALADAKDLGKYCAEVMADDVAIRRDMASGERRFLLRIAPYTRESGRSAGAVLTFTNVTAFRASLDQAVYEREYTKAILNTVSNPLVVLDAELRVQSANRAFYDMFGVSRETAQSVPLTTLGDDEWKASGLWSALTAILGDDKGFEVREVVRDFPALGLRTVVLDARRLSSAGTTMILLAFHDITERKRVEAALLESERRFREMVDALPVAVYTTDPQGLVTHFNPAAAEFAGRTPEPGIDQWCVTEAPVSRWPPDATGRGADGNRAQGNASSSRAASDCGAPRWRTPLVRAVSHTIVRCDGPAVGCDQYVARHHRAKTCRGSTSGGRSSQGRVPRAPRS